MSALRRPKTSDSDQVVYRGREFAGAVSSRGRAWLALDKNGHSLGRFGSRLEAVAAVLRQGGAT
jgi:hypothetical protein